VQGTKEEKYLNLLPVSHFVHFEKYLRFINTLGLWCINFPLIIFGSFSYPWAPISYKIRILRNYCVHEMVHCQKCQLCICFEWRNYVLYFHLPQHLRHFNPERTQGEEGERGIEREREEGEGEGERTLMRL
jgi:hypothetical protein